MPDPRPAPRAAVVAPRAGADDAAGAPVRTGVRTGVADSAGTGARASVDDLAGVLGVVVADPAGRDDDTPVLADVFEAMDDGVLVTDARGATVAFNRRAAQILGAEPAAMAGATLADKPWRVVDASGADVAPDDLLVARTLVTGTPHDDVVHVVRADGTRVEARVRARPVRDARGAVARVVACFTDVTGLHTTQARLREAPRAARRGLCGRAGGPGAAGRRRPPGAPRQRGAGRAARRARRTPGGPGAGRPPPPRRPRALRRGMRAGARGAGARRGR